MKSPAVTSQLNWTNRVINHCGWLCHNNIINQTVPKHWWEISQKNAVDLWKLFHDNKVNVVVNTDQNFMYFYPEEQVIVAPKVTKSINSKVKSNKKKSLPWLPVMWTIEIQRPPLCCTMAPSLRNQNPQGIPWHVKNVINVNCCTDAQATWHLIRSTGFMLIFSSNT